MDTELRQLRRVRWAVRGTLALGISASLAANVLHAHHLLIDQIIAGWPPVAVSGSTSGRRRTTTS